MTEDCFSLCMHSDPVGTTTASLIAAIPRDEGAPLVYRAGLGSPCCGVFLPLFLDVPLPQPLLTGDTTPAADSLWWACKQLVQWVEGDWPSRWPEVRQRLDTVEEEIEVGLEAAVQEPDRREPFVHHAVAQFSAAIAGLRAAS